MKTKSKIKFRLNETVTVDSNLPTEFIAKITDISKNQRFCSVVNVDDKYDVQHLAIRRISKMVPISD